MAWFKRSLRFTLLAIILTTILTLGFVINVPSKVQAQWTSEALSSKIPEQWELDEPAHSAASFPAISQGGDSRCNCLKETEHSLTPLVPASGIGSTIAEYPTIVWYIPKSSASAVEVVLRDANGQEIYSVNYLLTKTFVEGKGEVSAHGLMSLTLPALAHLAPLEIGQDYQWELALVCDRQDHSADVISVGGIKRVQLDPTLASRIQQATPQERVALYADARVWYETLTTLIELRRDRPNDKNLAEAWNKLLNSVGLSAISEEGASLNIIPLSPSPPPH